MNWYDGGAFLAANVAVMVLKQRGWSRTADETLLVLVAFVSGVVDLALQGKLQFNGGFYVTLGTIYTSARLNYEFIARHIPVVQRIGEWDAWGVINRVLGAIFRVVRQR